MKDDGSTTRSGHPIAVLAARLHDDLDAVTGVATWSLNPAETRDLLVQLTRATARLAELEARVLTHADEVEAGVSTGATSTATWLAHTTKQTRSTAHLKTHLAKALDAHDATREALGRGDLHVEQATVITHAVEQLPDDAAVRDLCEKHLITLAEHHDAKELKILGRRVLEVVDPDLADAHEANLLEREEREAAKKTSLRMHDDGHGQVHGRFTLPSTTAEIFRRALYAFAAPKHVRATQGAGAFHFEQPTPEKMGQAFEEFIEHYPLDRLPNAGGVNATVVITMGLDTLLGGIKAASLDTGEKISAGEARRLACEAGLVPAVLDGQSKVLDLGRRRRFHSPAQRLAIGLEQKHCQHPGCITPASGCHVHHQDPWSAGGRTDTKTARILCPRHHSLAHRPTPLRT